MQVLQYNPPTTLPFLRRNEILLRLRAPPAAPSSSSSTPSSADFGSSVWGPAGAADAPGAVVGEAEADCGTAEECGVPSD